MFPQKSEWWENGEAINFISGEIYVAIEKYEIMLF